MQRTLDRSLDLVVAIRSFEANDVCITSHHRFYGHHTFFHAEFLPICCETIPLRPENCCLERSPSPCPPFSRREGSNFKTKRYPKKRSTGPKSLTMSSGSIGLQDAVESKEYLCWKRSESVNQNHRPGRCSMIQDDSSIKHMFNSLLRLQLYAHNSIT